MTLTATHTRLVGIFFFSRAASFFSLRSCTPLSLVDISYLQLPYNRRLQRGCTIPKTRSMRCQDMDVADEWHQRC